MDFNKIKEAAKNYEADMTKFLRDIVKFHGESCDEEAHVNRIAEEMKKLGFDKVELDPMGNVLGYMGTGETQHSSAMTPTLILSALEILITGSLVPMKALSPKQRSADEVLPISWAASSPLFTVQKS